jgi:hypothetical protein
VIIRKFLEVQKQFPAMSWELDPHANRVTITVPITNEDRELLEGGIAMFQEA